MNSRGLLALLCVIMVVSGCSHVVPPTTTVSAADSENALAKSEAQRQALALAQAKLESEKLAMHRAKLRAVVSSDVIGLTEQQVLEKLDLDRLYPGEDGARWFSSGIVHFPSMGGYIIEKHHVLTFADGRVIKYGTTNMPTGCIIMAPVRARQ